MKQKSEFFKISFSFSHIAYFTQNEISSYESIFDLLSITFKSYA